jgi:hypothetical protein
MLYRVSKKLSSLIFSNILSKNHFLHIPICCDIFGWLKPILIAFVGGK